jgi:hypothetical protein
MCHATISGHCLKFEEIPRAQQHALWLTCIGWHVVGTCVVTLLHKRTLLHRQTDR